MLFFCFFKKKVLQKEEGVGREEGSGAEEVLRMIERVKGEVL